VRHMTDNTADMPPSVDAPTPPDTSVTDDTRVRVNLKLPAETHLRIRVWCVRKGVSMQGALEGMLVKAFARVDVAGGEPG
jgi:hypothetical protein